MLNKVRTHLNKLLFRLCYHEVTIIHISYFVKYLNSSASINGRRILSIPFRFTDSNQLQIAVLSPRYHYQYFHRGSVKCGTSGNYLQCRFTKHTFKKKDSGEAC